MWRWQNAVRFRSREFSSQAGIAGPDGLSVAREVGECALRLPITFVVQSLGFEPPSDDDIQWFIAQVREAAEELYGQPDETI